MNMEEKNKSEFIFIHNYDVMNNLKTIKWLIKDILVDNSFYYDFGDPASYKTFIALDRSLCIAAGIDYHGHQVKQGTVFYIAGEGQQGIGRRIAAWHAAHKTKAKDIPFFLSKTPTQLMNSGALDDVRRAVDAMSKEYGTPAVLHIDTLARNFGAGDESITKDMNCVIQNMDTAFGNDFCRGITHHTGHTYKDRARGSIALLGAVDTAFKIAVTDGKQVVVECKKMKDSRSAPTMLFDLKTIPLLIENHKDQSLILTLAAEGDEADAAAKALSDTVKISKPMKTSLTILDTMYAELKKNLKASEHEGNTPKVAFSDWQNAVSEKKIYKRSDSFIKAVTSMEKRKLVYFDDNKLYVYPKAIYLKYFNNEESCHE